MPAPKTIKFQQTETDIAVLQVQVQNIEERVNEIKTDLKEVNVSIEKNQIETNLLLKDMKDSSTAAHKSMSDKIGNLEKWRWMMMGAGIVLGSLGLPVLEKLVK